MKFLDWLMHKSGLDNRSAKYSYGDDPVLGLYLRAEACGSLGEQHLRVLLRRMRHATRRA